MATMEVLLGYIEGVGNHVVFVAPRYGATNWEVEVVIGAQRVRAEPESSLN
jgi:hypothetical protein